MPEKTIKKFLILELNNLKDFIWHKKFTFITYFCIIILSYEGFSLLGFNSSISLLSSAMWGVSFLFLTDLIKERWKRYKEDKNA